MKGERLRTTGLYWNELTLESHSIKIQTGDDR